MVPQFDPGVSARPPPLGPLLLQVAAGAAAAGAQAGAQCCRLSGRVPAELQARLLMSGAEEGNARNGCELTVLGNKPQRRIFAKCVQPTTPRSTRRPLRDAFTGAARVSLLI